MERAKSADAIFAIPEMSAQIVAAEEPITYNQSMLSHLRFGKSETLSASIDTTFFIALVDLNICDAVHNPIHQVGRLNFRSRERKKSSIHKITPKAAHHNCIEGEY